MVELKRETLEKVYYGYPEVVSTVRSYPQNCSHLSLSVSSNKTVSSESD